MLDLRLVVDETASGSAPVKVRCVNPNHDDPQASMAVYPDNIHCFGCGFHRNDWDECLSLLLGVSKAEAHAVAGQYSTERIDAYRVKAAQYANANPLPRARAEMYNRFMRESVTHRMSWYLQRGLTPETINRELLGHDGCRFSIPVYNVRGELVTIRFRRDDMMLPEWWEEDDGKRTYNPKYSGLKGRNGLYLYGAHWMSQMDTDFAIVTEGELDALLLRQHGFPAFSATNGARQVGAVVVILCEMLPMVRRLIVATDQDAPGGDAAIQVAKVAHGLGLTVVRWAWLEGKDITEHLMRRGRLDVIEGEWNGSRFTF